MQKKTKSLLEELQSLGDSRDINHMVESRATNIITSANTGLCWRTGAWTPALAVKECDPDLVKKPDSGSGQKPAPAAPAAPAWYSWLPRGRSRPASLRNSSVRLPRSSSKPFRSPATLKDWQGVPPTRTSIGLASAPIFVKSP